MSLSTSELRRKEYKHQWYLSNKDKAKIYWTKANKQRLIKNVNFNKEHYLSRIAKDPDYFNRWSAKRRLDPLWVEKRRASQRRSSSRISAERRKKLIAALGGECKKCGFLDWRALQIDHVNGGGGKNRSFTYSYGKGWETIISGVREGKLQLLCANCNWIKRYENKECTRKGDVSFQ